MTPMLLKPYVISEVLWLKTCQIATYDREVFLSLNVLFEMHSIRQKKAIHTSEVLYYVCLLGGVLI